jgi:hypothetical protein
VGRVLKCLREAAIADAWSPVLPGASALVVEHELRDENCLLWCLRTVDMSRAPIKRRCIGVLV